MKGSIINQFINFFWTILCFTPVFYYWMDNGITRWLYVFIMFSLVTGVLPPNIFKYFQISYKPVLYEHLGVRFIQKFVQDGTYINRAMRKNNAGHKVVNNRANAGKYMNTIAMYERYHFICFMFSVFTFVYALFNKQNGAAVFIMIANIIYNVYPILLQQYNKLRIRRLLRQTQ